MSNRILLGDDFWNTYNGLMDSKISGALGWERSLADLVTSANFKIDSLIKNSGIKYDEETLYDKVSSFEPFILGGDHELDDPNIYFSNKNTGLKESSKESKEDLMVSLYEIESRKPSISRSLR